MVSGYMLDVVCMVYTLTTWWIWTNIQASEQARRQISLLTSHGGACLGLPQQDS